MRLQLHQQNHQQYPSPHEAPRAWKSPSPAPQHDAWAPQQPQQPQQAQQAQAFVLHERPGRAASQPFQIQYSGDRYQNGEAPNHPSYTVVGGSPSGSPLRARTPQRREPVSLQQLQQVQTPVPAPPPDDMEPQNISFIGSAETDALRHGIDRLHISSGTRTYRIPSPTRPSLGRDSFRQPEEERTEKGFYISFDDEQPKRPKPPLRVKRGSPRKERTPSAGASPERGPDAWAPADADEPFVVHRAAPDLARPTERTPPRPAAEPAALVIGEVQVDPVSTPVGRAAPRRPRKSLNRISLAELSGGDGAQKRAHHADVATAAATRGRSTRPCRGSSGRAEGTRGRRQ